MNTWVTEIQAGSYALMDTAYTAAGLPFRQALTVLATVVSATAPTARAGCAVADVGLKSLGMDHGNPTVARRAGVVLLGRAHRPSRPRTAAARSATGCGCCPRTSTRRSPCTSGCTWSRGDEVIDTWAVDLRGW